MSPINKMMMLGVLILAGMLVLGGCGSSTANSEAPFNSTAGHSAGWLPAGHAQPAQAAPDSCSECHGSDLSGGISKVSCTPCHLNGSPFVLTNCTSCHGNPPTGTVAPNQGGTHAVHNALPNAANVCNSCHSGAGTNTANHYNGVVDVLLLSTYKAKSGSAVHNPDGTCSKVSCHGGQQTPAWLIGTIDVNTQCTSCHVYGAAPATPEYNSFYSGRHVTHVNLFHFPCTTCHDTTKLAVNHFTRLDTTTMEGPAFATILNVINYSSGSCAPYCHAPRTW
jgi:predicted CxxxxCH...CXXCH cytochrome family protein